MDADLLIAAIVGAVAVIGGAVGILWWAQWSPRRTSTRESPPPPVYMPVHHGRDAAMAPRPAPRPESAPATAPVATTAATEEARVASLSLAVGAEREHQRAPVDAAGAGLRPRRRSYVGRPALEASDPVPAPLTGTLRMLPGRLEVVSGLEPKAEIRFVHTGMTSEQRVTIGRAPGAPYEHVTLASQTVSRMHAALTFSRGGWVISNLSQTNPLRVNGAPVDVDGAAVILSDGDMVELGEVLLRFRS